MSDEHFLSAALRVLDGDESLSTAAEFEAVILDEYIEDDRLGEFLEALALYAPGSGVPCYEADELRVIVCKTVRELGMEPSPWGLCHDASTPRAEAASPTMHGYPTNLDYFYAQ